MLPPDMPAYRSLRSLVLQGQELHQIPPPVAAALSGLTSLVLRGGPITRIPPSISTITTLVTLTIDHYNLKLKVEDGDLDTLAALPRLKTLHVGGRLPGKGFLGNNTHKELDKIVRFMFKLGRRFPGLKVLGMSK